MNMATATTTRTETLYFAMEFFGSGDPAFGGKANDRVLSEDGIFIDEHRLGLDGQRQVFTDQNEALRVARLAKNLRPGGLLSVLPYIAD
jgi:hypothetical protein